MKPFDYYDTPRSKYYTFSDKQKEFERRLEAINNTPLTQKERELRISTARQAIDEWYIEKNLQFEIEADALRKEFFEDARVSLGYGGILSEKGIELLEAFALEGYCLEDKYETLSSLAAILKEVRHE